MPSLKEPAVAVLGRIVDIENQFLFVNGKATTQPDGVRVLIATGDGFASVKLKADAISQLQPDMGQPVAWWIRPGASGGGDREAKAWTSYIRQVTPDDLGRFQGTVGK